MALIRTDSKRPKYFDRQQLQAEDLTLEQGYQTQREQQLNRHLHGWGVVCGALLTPGENDTVTVEEGFAITPAGNTLHIPRIENFAILEAIQAAPCLGGSGNCEDAITHPDPTTGAPTPTPTAVEPSPTPTATFDPSAPPPTPSATPNITGTPGVPEVPIEPQTLYLIARPKTALTDPKTGIPEGCAHPGNQWQYARQCDALCLDVICELPDLHVHSRPSCQDMRQLFCPESRTDAYPELLNRLFPCPPQVSPQDNYVVLAGLNVGRLPPAPNLPSSPRGVGTLSILSIDYTVRRLLVPTQMLQQYLSCLCTPPPSTPSPSASATPTPTRVTATPTFTRIPTLTATFTRIPTLTASFTRLPTLTATFTGIPTRFPRDPTLFDFTLRPSVGVLDPLGPLTNPGIELTEGLDVRVFDPIRGSETPIDSLPGVRSELTTPLREMGIDSALGLFSADTVTVADRLNLSEVAVAEMRESALNSMARAQPIDLDEREFDIATGVSTPALEIPDVGEVRNTALRNSGMASVADVANAQPPQIARVLGVSEGQANTMIENARNRIRIP